MKLASSFIISTALHVLAIGAYPISRPGQISAPVFPITLWSFGEGGDSKLSAVVSSVKDTPEPRAAKMLATDLPTRREKSRRDRLPKPVLRTETRKQPREHRPPSTPTDQPEASSIGPSALALSAHFADADRSEEAVEMLGTARSRISKESGGGPGSILGEPGGGLGESIDSGVRAHTQVQLKHTPPPPYPNTARENGKEGRVLLRVLVDEEGKSKIVEVSRSSGSAILDQAAAEAIRRWRFSPALYGGTPTAAWIKIPIDFRLTEANAGVN